MLFCVVFAAHPNVDTQWSFILSTLKIHLVPPLVSLLGSKTKLALKAASTMRCIPARKVDVLYHWDTKREVESH